MLSQSVIVVQSQRANKALHVPTFDEVFETLAPIDTLGWFIFELRYRLSDDVSEQVYQSSPWLHFRAVCREWEPMLSDFQQRDAERPDVRSDGVGLAGDPLGCHVVGCPDERVGVTLCAEFAADSKVTELHLAVAA